MSMSVRSLITCRCVFERILKTGFIDGGGSGEDSGSNFKDHIFSSLSEVSSHDNSTLRSR